MRHHRSLTSLTQAALHLLLDHLQGTIAGTIQATRHLILLLHLLPLALVLHLDHHLQLASASLRAFQADTRLRHSMAASLPLQVLLHTVMADTLLLQDLLLFPPMIPQIEASQGLTGAKR